jgi:glycosyltransferase involved in cell wall biosynthesis
MKVLMFGWEFPPHITGGLGTACFGLTKSLSVHEDVELIFVVPKAFGDEECNNIQFIGANQINIREFAFQPNAKQAKLEYVEVHSLLLPYLGPDEFNELLSGKESIQKEGLHINTEGKLNFSGKYRYNLFQEVAAYGQVGRMIAESLEFDLIHAHDWLSFPAGITAHKISGKPLVVHIHSTDFDRNGGNVNPVIFDIEKEGMEVADKVFAVSELTKRTVIEKYGISSEKVITIHNGVEPAPIDEKIKNKKGVPEKIVTFLGRITKQKGPEYFIEAAKMVLDRMANVRFVMAGSGEKYAEMIRIAAHLNITNRFHFTGFLTDDEVHDLFRMSDILVMPSVSEPFGIVPLEAMQYGVPVIISKQSGVSEVLKHAIKIDYWDIAALADTIHGLISYPLLHSYFSKKGKAEVDLMQWENPARRIRQIYLELMLETAKTKIHKGTKRQKKSEILKKPTP